eukprot:jgi/Orpsp1_1/1185698/evm.model.c7180000094875.1
MKLIYVIFLLIILKISLTIENINSKLYFINEYRDYNICNYRVIYDDLNSVENSTCPVDTYYTIHYNNKEINELIKNLKKTIDENSVILFDLYDTLLIRPYIKPTDLFTHIEKLNNATGFAKARINAKGSTFDEIYQNIDHKYKWLKEKELSLEYNVTNIRPLIKEIYEYAINKNKKIIIISDLYFSKKYIIKILNKCGYVNFDKLYVFSEYSESKILSLLYNEINNELNIPSKSILYIGDINKSYKKLFQKLEIKTFYISNIMKLLFEKDSRIEKFEKEHKNDLGVSIMLGLLAIHFEKNYNNYWYEFGYKYGGPVILGYMQWLDEYLKKDKILKALFVARDGYTLEKVFNIIKTSDTSTYYLYLPRKIANNFFNKNKTISENSKKEFMIYLKQLNLEDNKLAIIDSVTSHWTSQRGLSNFFHDKDIKGYYWYTDYNKKFKKYRKNMNHETFQKDHKKNRFGILIELIMTAPTSPIIGLNNGRPIFKDITNSEKIRVELYPDLSNGAIDFTKDFIKYFDKKNIYFSCNMLIDWINTFKNMPTEIDKNIMVSLNTN